MKTKKKVVIIPIYDRKMVVYIHKKFDAAEERKYSAYVTYKHTKVEVHIKPDTKVSVIAHEAIHIANYVYKQTGARLDLYNDEPYSYLVGYIVKQINKLRKKS